MGFTERIAGVFRRDHDDTPGVIVAEAWKPVPEGKDITRAGYAPDIPQGGIDEYTASVGASTQTDRRGLLQQLFEAYLACPWSWACVNAIARTITAGGLVMDWDSDTGEGDEEPDKPAEVVALEKLIAFCNPGQDIRQLMRNVIVDLLVFGDAFLEITWWGKTPVAIWNLDSPTTTPLADEHGTVTGYVQVTDYGLRAEFDPHEVIHITLDSPRPGVFGLSPTHAALLPITAWLFWAGSGKEIARKGLPPLIHADFPAGTQKSEITRWHSDYMRKNIGPRNIGSPVTTKGGAHIAELQSGKIPDILASKDQARDEIIATYGVPPAQISIIESGNLGGGTGEEQRLTYKIDTCAPIAQVVLEKFNYAITMLGFNIDGWHAKFRDVDYRASAVIEQIRDLRIRNGTWTIDKARADAGEPPVDGGDQAVIIDRQAIVLVRDLEAMSQANIAAKGAPAVAAGEAPPNGEPLSPDQDGQDSGKDGQGDDDPGQPPAAQAGKPGQQGKASQPAKTGSKDGKPAKGKPGGAGQPPKASREQWARLQARVTEAWKRSTLAEAKADRADKVYDQLAKGFPPSTIEWVHKADWTSPSKVPIDKIDTADRHEWDATHEPKLVARFVRKLRRRRDKGKELKPAVLVNRPGHDKFLIADGHHRFLAYEENGQKYVWAWVGAVKTKNGPWNGLAAAQKDRQR